MKDKIKLKVGDIVAIIGKTKKNGGRWQHKSQLFNGKYVKNINHGGIWTGDIKKINKKEGMALVGGIWRYLDMYEPMYLVKRSKNKQEE